MILQTFKRYERKYLLDRAQLEALLPLLQAHMQLDEFCENGGMYEVHDLYFDTPDRAVVRGCALGPYFKEKLRLRFYDKLASDDAPCFLEYKKKVGKLGNKRRVPMTAGQARDFIQRGAVPQDADYLTRTILSEISTFIDGRRMLPCAQLSYRRLALFGKDDASFRATVDCALRADVRLPGERFERQIGLLGPDQYLLEVKIPGAMPIWLSAALSELQLFPRSHSKYGRAYALASARQMQECGEGQSAAG